MSALSSARPTCAEIDEPRLRSDRIVRTAFTFFSTESRRTIGRSAANDKGTPGKPPPEPRSSAGPKGASINSGRPPSESSI